jgi:phosphate transport system substrate-binding protein
LLQGRLRRRSKFFTEAVVGAARSSRTDYIPTEDDNVLVQGVANSRGGMALLSAGEYAEHRGQVRALAIDGGTGAVAPSAETFSNGQYSLARPVFIYVNAASLRQPRVQQFVQFYIENAQTYAEHTGYTPLPTEAYQTYLQRAQRRQVGTAFGGRAVIGASIEEVLSRPLTLQEVQQ